MDDALRRQIKARFPVSPVSAAGLALHGRLLLGVRRAVRRFPRCAIRILVPVGPRTVVEALLLLMLLFGTVALPVVRRLKRREPQRRIPGLLMATALLLIAPILWINAVTTRACRGRLAAFLRTVRLRSPRTGRHHFGNPS